MCIRGNVAATDVKVNQGTDMIRNLRQCRDRVKLEFFQRRSGLSGDEGGGSHHPYCTHTLRCSTSVRYVPQPTPTPTKVVTSRVLSPYPLAPRHHDNANTTVILDLRTFGNLRNLDVTCTYTCDQLPR